MAVPALNDYEYQFKEDSVLLNGTSALPFIDVNKVTGLDIPPVTVVSNDIDGRHGGSIYSAFVDVRTIVIEGTLYANPNTIEATIDTLITNYMPNNVNYPFFFKHPGAAQRYIMSKSIGVRFDVDTLRRTGRCPIQIQLAAEDPRKYINNADQTLVAATDFTPANPGNTNTYPIYTITGAYATLNVRNHTTDQQVTLSEPRIAGDITVVDLQTRSVTVNGINKSSVISAANWWSIPPGGGQAIRYTVTGGTPVVVAATRQGWM